MPEQKKKESTVASKEDAEKNCIFCKIARKEIQSEIVYENDRYVAFLDINPSNPGHTLIIPKKHYTNTLDTPDDIFAGMVGVAKLVAVHQIKHLKAEGFNLWVNNFPAAGQVIFHTHMHVVPRFPGDGLRITRMKEAPSEEEKTKALRKASSLEEKT